MAKGKKEIAFFRVCEVRGVVYELGADKSNWIVREKDNGYTET